MSTAEEPDQIAAEGAPAPIEISIVELGMVNMAAASLARQGNWARHVGYNWHRTVHSK